MGSFLKYISQHPQIIVVALVVGSSIIGRVVKALSEQAEKRRREQARQRAELEALRTGKATPAVTPAKPALSARDTMEKMASQRPAGVLVNRPAGTVNLPPPLPIPDSTRSAPQKVHVQTGSSSGSRFGTPRTEPAKAQRRGSRTKAPPTSPPPEQTAPLPKAEPVRRLVSDAEKAAPTVKRTPAQLSLMGSPLDAKQCRRAVALSEVLGAPVSLRP